MIENSLISGLVRSYLALSKIKEALHSAREAMKAMPQSAKALKLVGDVHASNSGGREKVCWLCLTTLAFYSCGSWVVNLTFNYFSRGWSIFNTVLSQISKKEMIRRR